MRQLLWVLLMVFPAVLAGDTKKPDKKAPKPPEAELVEISGKREGNLLFDLKLRSTGVRPLKGVVIFIDLLSSEKKVIATKRGALEGELAAAGDEAEMSVQAEDAARAVAFQIQAEDQQGREVRIDKPGPYPLE